MTNTRRIALLVAVVLAAALAGCGAVSLSDSGESGPSVDPSNYSAESLQQEAQASMQDVTSLTMGLEMDVEVEGESASASMSMEADAAANYESQRVHYETLEVTQTTMGGEQTVSGEAYLVGNTMHVDRGNGWRTMPAESTTWSQSGPAQQTELLEGADVSIDGAEVVDGEDTLAVSVEPTDEALATIAAESAASEGLDPSAMEIESATVTQWIAAEDPHYVRKAEVEMTALIQGQPVDISMTTTMDDLGEDVTIELPEDVR